MSVYNVDKNTINATVGALARDVDRLMLRAQQTKTWLLTIPDATLTANYGYVQADVDLLRSTLNDLDQLRTIYQGTGNLAVAKDFTAFGKQTYAYGSI